MSASPSFPEVRLETVHVMRGNAEERWDAIADELLRCRRGVGEPPIKLACGVQDGLLRREVLPVELHREPADNSDVLRTLRDDTHAPMSPSRSLRSRTPDIFLSSRSFTVFCVQSFIGNKSS